VRGLVPSTFALAVGLTGIGRSSAADSGVLDYCVTNAQVVQRVQLTVRHHTYLVLVNTGVAALKDKHASTFVVPTMRKECVR
jgi:hypothetical protein